MMELSIEELSFILKYRQASPKVQEVVRQKLKSYGRLTVEAEQQAGNGNRHGHESA